MGAIDNLAITATNPSDTVTETIYPKSVTISATLNESAVLRFEVHYDVDRFLSETDTDNILQLNSIIEVTRANTIFKGVVFNKTIRSDSNSKWIEFDCIDRIGMLNQAIPSVIVLGTHYSTTNGYETVSDVDIYPLHTDATYNQYGYPDPTDSTLWMPNSGGYHTVSGVLLTGINATDTEIVINSEKSRRFTNAGIVSIGSEWIYYQGANLNAAGFFQLSNCKRACLGTTAAAHSAAALIAQQSPKRISLGQSVAWSMTSHTGDVSQAIVMYDRGCLYFPDGTLTAYPAGTMDYSWNNEDDTATTNSTFFTLESTINRLIGVVAPGWDAIEYAAPKRVVPWVKYSAQTITNMIDGIISETSSHTAIHYGGYGDEPTFVIWHNPADDKIHVLGVAENSPEMGDETILFDPYSFTRRLSLNDVTTNHVATLEDHYNEGGRFASGFGMLTTVAGVPTLSLWAGACGNDDAYAKLASGGFGVNISAARQLGATTNEGARSAAANQVRQSLTNFSRDTYTFRGFPGDIDPTLAARYSIAGDSGYCVGWTWKMVNNAEEIVIELADVNNDRSIA